MERAYPVLIAWSAQTDEYDRSASGGLSTEPWGGGGDDGGGEGGGGDGEGGEGGGGDGEGGDGGGGDGGEAGQLRMAMS
jgi:hypothetical protein